MSGLPVVLDVSRRPCLVVGAGRAARWKLAALVSAGAAVTVIAPQVSDEIAATAPVTVRARRVQPGDTAGFGVVVVATDDPAVNDAVAAEAAANGALVLRADGAGGDLRLPAVHRVGHLSIAVDTDGTSPTLARWVRDRLAARIPPAWASLAGWAAVTRPRTADEIDHHLAELQR